MRKIKVSQREDFFPKRWSGTPKSQLEKQAKWPRDAEVTAKDTVLDSLDFCGKFIFNEKYFIFQSHALSFLGK